MEKTHLNRTENTSTKDNSKDIKRKKKPSHTIFSSYSNFSLEEKIETKQSSKSNKNNNSHNHIINEFLNEMDKAMEEVTLNDEIENPNEENNKNISSYEFIFNGTFKPENDENDAQQKGHHHHHHKNEHHHHHHHLHDIKEEKNE